MYDNSAMSKEEAVFTALRTIYTKAGYRPYRMRKFEEYSLYLENLSFLPGKNLITFNDPDGRLLALKPDVTLSIIKNTKADGSDSEKLFYRESVYRTDGHSREYREICQAGVESIGESDLFSTLEIIMLAAETLKAVDSEYILDLSHMGFIRGMLADCGVNGEEAVASVTECISAKNKHDLHGLAARIGIDPEKAEKLAELISADTDFSASLEAARSLVSGPKTKAAVSELEAIGSVITGTPYESRIRLDFSIVSDMSYYNGIIMRGYVRGVPRAVLSGGRYDKLVKRFGKDAGAMGFAINLSEVAAYYGVRSEFDADILLLYGDDDPADGVFAYAEKLREGGKSVAVFKRTPKDGRYARVIEYGAESEEKSC